MVRAAVKTLNKTTEAIKADAKIEADRKKASKKALREALALEKASAEPQTQAPVAKVEPTPEEAAAKVAADSAALRDALMIDAKAMLGDGASQEALDAYVAEQMAPVAESESKARYTGPMLALRAAAKHYVTAANGNPCNGDQLATAVGSLTREEVVFSLLFAMKLETNPYLHLNPGQQSMNTRNKARGMLKNGTLTIAEVQAAVAKTIASRKPAATEAPKAE